MLLAAGREVVSKTSAYNITKLSYRVAREQSAVNRGLQNLIICVTNLCIIFRMNIGKYTVKFTTV